MDESRPPRGLKLRRPTHTVRARLALLYGGLILASGAVLIGITTVLWGQATTAEIRIPFALARQIVNHFPKGLPAGRPRATKSAPGGPNAAAHFPPPGPPRGLRHLASELRGLEVVQHGSDLHQLLLYGGIALGGMAIISVGLGWLVGGRVLRPLRTITAATRDISATNLHRRLDLRGPSDELKELGDTVDDLLARLETAFASQRQFVANASHELRTPLTTMQASLEVALAKPGPLPAETATLANRLSSELDHMKALLESLLALARAERGPSAGRSAELVDDLVTAALAAHSKPIAAAGLHVAFEPNAASVISGDGVLLAGMVDNVIDNAVRHNEPAGFVRVSSEVSRSRVRLIVENGGPLLSGATVAALREPFRRAGADRTGSDGGLGLGLSIVAAVAETHGGHLELAARAEGGLRVELELPLATAAPALVPA